MPSAHKTFSWNEIVSDCGDLVGYAIGFFIARARWIAIFFLLVAVIAAFLFPHDREILRRVQSLVSAQNIAAALSFWGDYPTGTIGIVGCLWLTGVIVRRHQWRRAALACLLAASCAGLFNNCFRFTVGRPRPLAEMPDGIYGPSFAYKMNSFPSGHSATSVATAASLLIAIPPLGVPACVGAAGVVWSRMELDCHYPSDVLVGSSIGLLFGLAFGFAARQRLKHGRN